MFYKEPDDNIMFFDDGKRTPDVPTEVRIPDLAVPPLAMAGAKSGAYLVAQYCQALKFCLQDYMTMTTSQIETAFYDNLPKTDGYVRLTDAMDAATEYVGIGDAVYFRTIPFLKRFLHRYGMCVVELLPDTAICSTSTSGLAGVFDCPVLTNEMFDDKLTKGFIACGYDTNGVLLQNSLG
jgi:hypothetical protein